MNEKESFPELNCFKVFCPEDMDELKAIENNTPNHFGYVYFIEYGDLIKIGYSKAPYKRLITLKRQGEGYSDKKIGRIALTPMCTNYVKIEMELHELFKDKRKDNTELFEISFYDAVTQTMGFNLSYLDESKEIEKHMEESFQFLKAFVTGGF